MYASFILTVCVLFSNSHEIEIFSNIKTIRNSLSVWSEH